MINDHSTILRTSRKRQPTHYLALWIPTGELVACVPIGEHVQLRHQAVTRLLDSADAYGAGALAVYPVALTDDLGLVRN
jgi:hypothetical protein